MEDKNIKNKACFYIVSLSIIVNYIILWFLQIEIYLWVCLGIGVFGVLGAILRLNRKTYMDMIISIRVLNLVGALFIIKKAFKYILIPGNVLNLLGDIPFGNIINSITNFASIALIVLLSVILWLINVLILMSYNIVYLVKLHKEKEVNLWKCILRFFGYGLPLIGWMVLLIDLDGKEHKHKGRI